MNNLRIFCDFDRNEVESLSGGLNVELNGMVIAK
jgi:hypothetical protein